ncbi:hypothetical protein ABH930_004483 [Kitasatospora sp. GAS204A]|uniref:hypothetical protein n=1 Tax=Kitasatospora sp. GAS204B TaxID=3035283 RepID=UPI00247590BC|nr:hypothetical protein [Kitasatospora sp. GAS204B]MDH6119722.1 hypothetical protein [Kitasatospora sp. GAS204B]
MAAAIERGADLGDDLARGQTLLGGVLEDTGDLPIAIGFLVRRGDPAVCHDLSNRLGVRLGNEPATDGGWTTGTGILPSFTQVHAVW